MIKKADVGPDSPATTQPRPIDIAILTIREDEFRAVLNVFKRGKELRKGRRHYNLRTADAGGGKTYRIAIVRQVEQGNGEAQDAARDIIEELQPRLLLVVGIAGGLPSDDFTLGDVVVSTRINDYSVEARKEGDSPSYSLSGGPMAREIAAGVVNLAAMDAVLGNWAGGLGDRPRVDIGAPQTYGPTEWQALVREKLSMHFGVAKNRPPLVTTGTIATSDRLVKDPNILFPWIQTARHILAVEMESGGVYRAARERAFMLAIRGISDIVGLKRDDHWTKFACSSAAAFVRAYLKTTPIPVLESEHRQDSGQKKDISLPEPSIGLSFDCISADATDAAKPAPRLSSVLIPYQAQGLFLVSPKGKKNELKYSDKGFITLMEEFLALGCLRIAVPAGSIFDQFLTEFSAVNSRFLSLDKGREVFNRVVALLSPVAEELRLPESGFLSITPILPAQAEALVNEKNPERKRQIAMLSYIFEHTYSLLLGFEYKLQVSLNIVELRRQLFTLRDNLCNPKAKINLSSLIGLLRTYEAWNIQTLEVLNSREAARHKSLNNLVGNDTFRHLSEQMYLLGMPSKNRDAVKKIAELATDLSEQFHSEGLSAKDRIICASHGVTEPESELEHDVFVRGFLSPIVPLKGLIWTAYARWASMLPDKYTPLSLVADGRERYFLHPPMMIVDDINDLKVVFRTEEPVDLDDADYFATRFPDGIDCPRHAKHPIAKWIGKNKIELRFCCKELSALFLKNFKIVDKP